MEAERGIGGFYNEKLLVSSIALAGLFIVFHPLYNVDHGNNGKWEEINIFFL
jgi:hypothetical protein